MNKEFILSKFEDIENKISTVHNQIDEVIKQIEYIKMLAKNEHIIDDLELEFVDLKDEKDFIDGLSLKLPSDDFMKYLSLY